MSAAGHRKKSQAKQRPAGVPLLPRSAMPGVIWPPLPSSRAVQVLALLQQLRQSQWWDPERLRQHQLRQLGLLFEHAAASVPYYVEPLSEAGYEPGQPLGEEVFRRLPVLTRGMVQTDREQLLSTAIPPQHGRVNTVSTAGSTGRPVVVSKTQLMALIGHALVLREHDWHRRDMSARMAVIRFVRDPSQASPPDGMHQEGWDALSHQAYPTGPVALLDIQTPVDVQLRWLQRERPDYLMTYPSNLHALLEFMASKGQHLKSLKGIHTISEVLGDATRELVREVLNVPLTDSYSNQEAGLLASQCPDCGNYHVHAESVLLEVLGEDGIPCPPGETGRVVITDLHNFAMPLLRYETGDLAEVGEPCSGGRGLPTLRRIVGRVRNMLTLPDGRQVYPRLRTQRFAAAAGVIISQIQVVQKSLEEMELKMVCEPLTAEQERVIAETLCGALGHPFHVDFAYADQIPRGPGGTFEDFLSEL